MKRKNNSKIFIQNLSNYYYGNLGMLQKEDCVALSANIMVENGYTSIVAATSVLGLSSLRVPKEKHTLPEVKLFNFKKLLDYYKFIRKYKKATVFGNARTIVGLSACLFGDYTIFMSHTCTLPKNWWQRRVFKYFLKKFAVIKTESESEKKLLINFGIDPNRIFVIPIPIDYAFLSKKSSSKKIVELKKKYGIKKNEKIIIFLAYLREQKKADTILKAIRILKDKGKKVKLLQVGQDLLKERIGKSFLELAEEFGVKDNIICAGTAKNKGLRDLIHLADIGVQSSDIEGQCLVAFEYAAAGIPECLSNIPSFEIFGKNILRHNTDDYKKLATNFEFYIDNPKIAQAHAKANQKLVREKYDYDMIKKKMKELLIDKKDILMRKSKFEHMKIQIGAQIHKIRVLKHIIKTFKNWPSFLIAHFFHNKKRMIVYLRNGYKVLIRPYLSDATMLMETWGMMEYTPKGFEIRKNDTVIDIGGHIGSFSLYAGWKAKNGKVFTFEPFPENFQMLSKNIKMNNAKNIFAEKKAIGPKKGKSYLYLYDGMHSGSSSLYYRNTDQKIPIVTTTLKDVFEKNKIQKIDFMKIDCEGAEYDILFNLPKSLLSRIDKISMEYHDTINEHNHPELMDFFKKNNFSAKLVGEFIYARRR